MKFNTKKKLIWYFLKGSRRYFVMSALFAALVALLDMISPRIISFTVDSVIGNKAPSVPAFVMHIISAAGGMDMLRRYPVMVAAAAAATGALAAAARYLFRMMNALGSETMVRRMRDELFSHILTLPYTWLGENSTGDIIQRCTSDVQTVKRFISENMTSLIRTLFLITMALSFMAGLNRTVMFASAVYIPVIIFYSLFFYSKIGSAFEKADEEEGILSTIAQENLTGVRVVRAFGRESYERERFEKQNEKYTGHWVWLIRLLSAFWASGDVLTGAQTLTVIVTGAFFCVRGSLTAGDYIALVSYTIMLAWPVRSLGRVISELSKAGIAIERLRYIMDSEPERDREGCIEPPMDRDIVFDHVSFGYDKTGGEVLRDVSFSVPAGSTLGILGGTGSGKSTLMYLLERLYELPEGGGSITIGGVDIRNIRASYLRTNIGMVLQEPFLFSRKLSENIGIAAGTSDLKRIRRAAKAAKIDDAIESFTAGYDTFVGERGVTLSGGQKQRTAIAQMLIRESPVMIFDDSLSAVDAETDLQIRRALRERTGCATVILIAHRITTLMKADNIIVLDKGRIIQQGTHEKLLSEDGMYRKIYDLQSAGAEAEA